MSHTPGAEPAYPSHIRGEYGQTLTKGGLSKREMVAMHALQGLLANGELQSALGNTFRDPKVIANSNAEGAVISADALLAALGKDGHP